MTHTTRTYVPRLLLVLAVSGAAAAPCHAVLITLDDGSGNTAPPVDDFGLANVGSRGGATAIYLENRWVLTAFHVGAGSVDFGGTSYNFEDGTQQRLTNPTGFGLTPFTDMVMFQLQTDPGLPTLSISNQTPLAGSEIVMAGNGKDRETNLTEWHVVEGPTADDDVWQVPTAENPANRSGYLTTNSRKIRWGRNSVSGGLDDVNANFGDVRSFFTTLDAIGGFADEAQAVGGDSGGAAFYKNGDTWELAGMMHAVEIFENQPLGANSAVFGNQTFAADMAFYGPQIRSIISIPEPSGALLPLAVATLATLGSVVLHVNRLPCPFAVTVLTKSPIPSIERISASPNGLTMDKLASSSPPPSPDIPKLPDG